MAVTANQISTMLTLTSMTTSLEQPVTFAPLTTSKAQTAEVEVSRIPGTTGGASNANGTLTAFQDARSATLIIG